METSTSVDRVVVTGAVDGCASALTVRWDPTTQRFHVHGHPLPNADVQPIGAGESDRDDEQERAQVSASLARFDDAMRHMEVPTDSEAATTDEGDSKHEHSPLGRLVAQRDELLALVLASKTPLPWLERLLTTWKARLESLVTVAAAGSPRFLVWLNNELLVLAAGFQIIGDMPDARLASGLALRVVRLPLPRGAASAQATAIQELRRAAKRDLLTYIAFDTAVSRNRLLSTRRDPPTRVLTQLASELGALRLRAPLSVPILTAMASLMQRQHRHATAARLLAASSLTGQDAGLALLYVRTLERDGFWSHSVAVARRFLANRRPEPSQQNTCDQLGSHATRVASLHQLRDQAERLAQTRELDRAVDCFSTCLELMGAERLSGKVASSLLLGRANALLALGKPLQALRDLEASVQLHPSNAVAQLVLKTTLLEQETNRIQLRLRASSGRSR